MSKDALYVVKQGWCFQVRYKKYRGVPYEERNVLIRNPETLAWCQEFNYNIHEDPDDYFSASQLWQVKRELKDYDGEVDYSLVDHLPDVGPHVIGIVNGPAGEDDSE